ncbi:4-coumarate--CoA ligase-like 9 isoform X2 [Mangifera indica]|uniref:4-coumarate--CoA ligase-like 9 isoform X2 n=1 Tax=Mangifera indica TaxID=29780 RepID=UPI001CFA5C10|nr:4-coumarate--CoA ligase-like 9 isoform X2 [Mangifera indica]
MAPTNANSNLLINPENGYCPQTKTYHTLRPKVPLPLSQSLSITQFLLSLPQTAAADVAFLINAFTGERLTYGQFLNQLQSLAFNLRTRFSLSKGDVAFILLPSSFHVPALYFSLLSLGVIISPANPLASASEISHQLHLTNPSIAFTTSHTSRKLPSNLRTVLIDSPDFISMSTQTQNDLIDFTVPIVNQADSAAILYSSGTSGKVKGVLLTHRNLIALAASFYHSESQTGSTEAQSSREVTLSTVPLFHVYGFLGLMMTFTVTYTLVLMERFDFEKMLKAIEKYRVSHMAVSPPLIVTLTKSELTKSYDLSSLQLLHSGGAPLGKEVTLKFKEKFPDVELIQGYGMTESGGVGAGMRGPDEANRYGSVGRLYEFLEAKIVDPATGEALPPDEKGELWLRGITIMKGYVGDDKATAETFSPDGWLKTGDLCYFDSHGFLFIVDRLKELIKYKAYQVPPAELEHLLHSNHEIADAAVIPYSDEEAGQIPMAFVVRRPGSNITAAQVMDFIAKQVAPYKKIRRVAFIDSIPKSPAGKILRRELVTRALSTNLSKL